jgi:dipeptidyl aminopeptidase/acylaminoacyl peptidase
MVKVKQLKAKKIKPNKNELPITPRGSVMRNFLIFGLLSALIGGVIILLQVNNSKPAQQIKDTIKQVVTQTTITPQPTPYPFYELTIPYLRSQTYTSSLTTLEEVSTNDSYTSYVTSFTSDGFKVNGLLTQPAGDMPEGGWPAIVFIHGYIPPNDYATLGQPYSTYVDYLASNGFVVYKIDLRGHGDSEGEPGGAYYSSEYVKDALNAYSALQNADFVNPEKIGLWGHSMAGNISLRTAAAKPEIPAIVIWGGAGYTYTDLLTYRISDSSFDPNQSNSSRLRKREQIRKLYGDPDPSKPFWQQLAPTSYLNDLQGTIQLHHAVDDDVVDVRYSRDLTALLEQTSVRHELYEYPTGGHNITDASFVEAMDRTVVFFKKYL